MAERRRAAVPPLVYPEALPVSAERERIAAAIRDHQVTVVCGATGSGKSTQLPKICLGLGRGAAGMIGHTQPRRIAARSIATRIAEELGPAGAGLVGWKVRFHDRTGPDCQVKVMTDGILLAEIRQDPRLLRYDTLIVDEAHERSLNIDFLLGYLHRLLPARPDLKLIITSATIDPQRFAAHFASGASPAPIVEVGGSGHPVELRYRPPQDSERLSAGVLAAADELTGPGMPAEGDVLVFLPGEREIRETAEALRKHHPPHTEILPLYGRLSSAEQDRVFHRSGRRRVVLATNVAETSLTVPGIRYVVDSGLARISRYSYRSKIQRLQVEPISRASADQRRGRCGREREGICIRLYEEEDYLERAAFTDPEIRRTNLASVILQMETLGLGSIGEFPFLDPPDPRFVRDGYRLLRQLGAVDAHHRVTETGRRLARLPVDPQLGRMLLAAAGSGCLRELLVIASALAVQDPRERPVDRAAEADERHALFAHERSDFLTLLGLWDAWQERRRHDSGSAQRRWCREHCLSFLRLLEWQDVHRQLLAIVKDMGYRPNEEPADYAAVHRAVLAGFLSHIGRLDERREYQGARNTRFQLFGDSALAARPPSWVVVAALVETARVWGRTAAAVEPQWIESAGAHLLRRSWSDPCWQAERGFVTALERVSLFGLVLAADRRVDFGRVEPAEARRLFIRDGLVAGTLRTRGRFLAANRALVAEVQGLEAKLRRRELLAGEPALCAFYDARIPQHVCRTKDFERWRQKAERNAPDLLLMSLEDLLTGADLPRPDDCPDTLEVGANRLPLSYVFHPGSEADGVTVTVPRHLLPLLDEARAEWLIPGWLPEKITALLRALPKPLRRRIVPVPDTARRCLAEMRPGQGRLRAALAAALERVAGIGLEPEVWERTALEPWLELRIALTDEHGQLLAASRDAAALKRRYLAGTTPVPATLAGSQGAWGGSGFRDWRFGPMPGPVEIVRGATRQRLFPGIADEGGSVACRLYATAGAAAAATRRGVLRLFVLALPQQYRELVRQARGDRELVLLGRELAAEGDLAEEAARAAFAAVFLPDDTAPPRDAASFRARLDAGRATVIEAGEGLIALLREVLALRARIQQRLGAGLGGPGAALASADIDRQLARLVYAGFVRDIAPGRLAHLPRYLRAILVRIERLAQGRGEARQMLELAPHGERLATAAREWSSPDAAAAWEGYRWMVEEFRVSLFAQQLGTAGKVSHARLEEHWARVQRLEAGMAVPN